MNMAGIFMPALVVGIISLKGCTAFNLLVPRITLEAYLASPVYNSPVLIRDIVSSETIELLADTLMNSLGTETVSMQRKTKKRSRSKRSKSTTEIYDIALQHSIDYMMDSCHDDAYFAFCEGLLPINSFHDDRTKLSNDLKNIREAPFSNQENWFDYFPTSVQPTDAIILAGTGSTSTLHRDPFEWTGTSLCLEGTKIWRFILPPQNSSESNVGGGVAIVDEALKSYRLNSIAWEEDEEVDHNHGDVPVILSAGWQSDMTLYDSIDEQFPSGFELMELEEEEDEKFDRELEAAVLGMSRLRPSNDALGALDQIAQSYGTSNHSSPFITAIQRQGDLLIIPAHCWHQTYAPVPSVAVASQRCGATVDGANVIKHVIGVSTSNCNEEKLEVPDLLQQDCYKEGVGSEVVTTLLAYVTSTR